MDEVSGGREPWGRRRWVALGVVAVLVVAALAADRAVRSTEVERLREVVVASERTLEASRDSVSGVREYQAALVARDDLPDETRRLLRGNVARDAARWLPRLDADRSAVHDVAVLPWHDDVAAAREAYVARLDAWHAYIEGTAEQRRRGQEPSGSEMPRTREAAEELLQALLGDGAPPLA